MYEHEINSLLDTDMYKLTMAQAVFHQFPAATVRYRFKNRTEGVEFTKQMYLQIRDEINALTKLRLYESEKEYLKKEVTFLTDDFLDFLSQFRFNPAKYVKVTMNPELEIIVKGPWLQTILFEVPILAIVNATYFKLSQRESQMDNIIESGRALMDIEMNKLVREGEGFTFADFGTRRRFSHDWHDYVIKRLSKTPYLAGTSNVFFAKEYGLRPIGTMAHEWIQAGQAFTHPRDSQKFMLDRWVDEYQGQLGTALSDTMGFDYFLKDFNLRLAKLYDGIRLDSGDPHWQTEKFMEHLRILGIDPSTKTVVYSDGLNFDKALALYHDYHDKVRVAFGIGTFITNHFPTFDPLQIVMKMTHCNGLDVAKISDTPAKAMCESKVYTAYLNQIIQQELV